MKAKRGIRLGLTGCAGAGKSLVGAYFTQRGWKSVSADAIVRDLYAKEPQLKELFVQRMGSDLFDEQGTLDRQKLAQRIFEQPHLREWIEQAVHPRAQTLWLQAMKSGPSVNWIVEVPLLYEGHFEQDFDAIVLVHACEAALMERLKACGWPLGRIETVLALQNAQSDKLQRADFVLVNEGSLSALEKQVNLLIDSMPYATG